MARNSLAALVAVWFLLASSARAGEAPALAEARAALDKQDALRAVDLVEAALPSIGADQRASALAFLKAAYPAAIAQAEASGQSRKAAACRENLAILNPNSTPAAAPAAPVLAPTPAAPPAAPVPAGAEGIMSPPPASLVDPPAASTPRAAKPGGIDPAAAEAAAPQAAPVKPAPVQPVAQPNIPIDPPDIHNADAAFQAKRYDIAGKIYAALAARKQLPEVRKNPWAYCRMAAVVDRINKGPQSAEDWKSIQLEIVEIRKLSPELWYSEYLRNLVAELSNPTKKPADGRMIVRGSSPDEPPRTAPTTRAARRQAPPPGAPPATVGQAGKAVNNWQVWDTPSFRIFHNDDKLAPQVAQIAEATRQSQLRLWGRQEVGAAWAPRCDIYIYPSAAVYAQMTSQPEDSPGFSTMGINAGQVVARRINLRADHANLLNAILPHEITHVVLADIFNQIQIPRWADEGLAVLAEPASEQQLRAADLSDPIGKGQLFQLADLMTMDYPDGQYWTLYYAQSVSLTRFLVEQGTPGQFVEFLRAAQRNGVEAELERVYRIAGYGDLQKRWFAYAKSTAASANTSRLAAETPAGAATRR